MYSSDTVDGLETIFSCYISGSIRDVEPYVCIFAVCMYVQCSMLSFWQNFGLLSLAVQLKITVDRDYIYVNEFVSYVHLAQ
jgi:hypothetical protein